MRSLTIGLDMDEVVAALLSEWLRRYNLEAGDTKTPEDIRGWALGSNVKDGYERSIYEILKEPDLYDHVVPMPYARQVVDTLRQMGHRVVFITSCTTGTMDAKQRWLERWGFLTPGEYLQHDFIAASDKALVAGIDALFDDNVKTVERFPGRAFLVMVPHNTDEITRRQRVKLQEIPHIVSLLAEEPYKVAA